LAVTSTGGFFSADDTQAREEAPATLLEIEAIKKSRKGFDGVILN